jgi:putative hydroxymethylpyrimidine transport system permease protein
VLRALSGSLYGMVVLLCLWQLAVMALAPPRYILPAPVDVFAVLFERRVYLLHHAGLTTIEIVLGLVFGSLAGMALAFSVAAVPALSRVVWPAMLAAQALPVFAIAPLLVLWFGFGLTSKVVMAGLIIFFPVASAFADGLRRTDPDLVESAALMGAGHWRILMSVRVPLAMPALVTGLRVAAPLAPLGAVIGEWVGAAGGLGFIMLQANARMQTEMLFAALLILMVLTLALRFLVDELARILAPWATEDAP